MEKNQLDFPKQNFMLNHFKRKSLKKKIQIGLFKDEKVAPTEKKIIDYLQRQRKIKILILLSNFPKLWCMSFLSKECKKSVCF